MISLNNLRKVSEIAKPISVTVFNYFVKQSSTFYTYEHNYKKNEVFQRNRGTSKYLTTLFCTYSTKTNSHDRKVKLPADEKVRGTIDTKDSDDEDCVVDYENDGDNDNDEHYMLDDKYDDDDDEDLLHGDNAEDGERCEDAPFKPTEVFDPEIIDHFFQEFLQDKFNIRDVIYKIRKNVAANCKKKEEIIISKIIKKNPELEKSLKILIFEINVLREKNDNTPVFIKEKQWITLLNTEKLKKRELFLFNMFKNEVSYLRKCLKQRDKCFQGRQKHTEILNSGKLIYSLQHNSILPAVYKTILSKRLNERLIAPALFGQHVVFDCSYEEYMTSRTTKDCAKQLAASFAANRVHQNPFHFKLCNLNKNGLMYSILDEILHITDDFMWDLHEESFLKLYPKDKLVYLTPHTQNELTTFNPDDVYIIGAFVDKGKSVKASSAKAKQFKLRTAKFPIDSYLAWAKGSKSLPLNTVSKILLDLNFYNSWRITFDKNIPKRFLTHEKKIEKKLSPQEYAVLNKMLITQKSNLQDYKDNEQVKNISH